MKVPESEFSFSERGDVDQALSEFIDLTVPVTYRVKFNFTPEKVMMRLSKDRLRRLNKVWEQSEDGLTLVEFMKLMILEVPSIKDEKLELIQGLIRLFKQVDINGDQMMQWSEFVQYIIDQVQTESIVATQDGQGNVTSIKEIIHMQQAGRFHKLKRSGKPQDKGRHKRPMQDVIMCPDERNKDKTLVMHSEENSTTLQWYRLNLKPICSMEVPVKASTDKVLSIAHQDISKSLYAFGPQGTDAVYGILCSDHMLYLYIRNRGRIELFHQMHTGKVLQTKVWFMPKHKAWLTAGKDFKIRQWNISPIAQKHEMGDPVQLHSDLITDCVEIINPFCVATCSLDRTIVLYDLKNREALRRFARKHVTGVRNLRYLQDYGGMIISTGFEIYANVWGPQNLFGNAHLGRLKGHRNPIVAIDVLQGRPFVYTMDRLNEIIIWDIRSFNPLQIIPALNTKEKMSHGLMAIRADMIWVYGSRFITYDRQEVFAENEVEAHDAQDQRMAVNAFHNQFFSTICVQTPQDLKIYSCLDGQLMVMHQSVFKHPNVNCHQIRQDKRHRKAYLASNDGQINVINIQSGVTLKKTFEEEDQQNDLEQKNKQMEAKLSPRFSNAQSPKSSKPSKSTRPPSQESLGPNKKAAFLTEAPKEVEPYDGNENQNETAVEVFQASETPQKREIVDMILVWEDKMNQMIYADKHGYYVYKEEDEHSEKLRSVKGGHKANISAIKFSYHLSLIATGTESGEVAVWDYELSQLLGICQGHSSEESTGEITAIEFLQPYPVMVTAGLDSKICLWAVRPAPMAMCYLTIATFNNISFNYVDDTKYAAKTLLCHSGDKLKGISRGRCMKHSQINAETYRDYKTNQVMAVQEAAVRVDGNGNYRGLSQMKDIRLRLLKEALQANEEGKTKIEDEFEAMRHHYIPRMEYLDPEYDGSIDEEKLRIYLYIGDDFGIIKLWDLSYLLSNSGLQPCPPVWEVRGDQYFPSRSELVNVSSYAARLRNIAQMNSRLSARIKDPEDSGLIIRECVGHEKSVTQFNHHNFDGLISVGNDFQVRVWSHSLDLWGIIDSRHYEQDVLWYFPTRDRRESQLNDIIQMQILADSLRASDEQAVEVERDSDLDNDGEEHFTSKATYKKFKANVMEKKRLKAEQDQQDQQAIIEERREFNLAIALSKNKAPEVVFEQKPWSQNLRAIERIEELIHAEKQLHTRIDEEQKERVEVKGEVVEETAKQMDKLIRKALRKHDRHIEESPSGKAKLNRRQQKFTRSRNSSIAMASDNSSNQSRRHVSVQRKMSKLSVSPDGSPTKRSSPTRKESIASSKQLSPLVTKRNLAGSVEEGSPTRINLKRVPMGSQESVHVGSTKIQPDATKSSEESKQSFLKLPKVLTKNKQASNLSASSVSVESTVKGGLAPKASQDEKAIIESSRKKISPNISAIAEIREEVKAEFDGDGEESSNFETAVRIVTHPIERTLDQLNQTMTLIKKAEASANQKIIQEFAIDTNYIEETKQDRQSLIQCKNLPTIRDKLLTIKSKQQKAFLNPKYNRVTQQMSVSPSPSQPQMLIQDFNTPTSRVVGQSPSRVSLGPFSQQRKTHEQAMKDLSVIAKDLETYNKNRYFNDRARSMIVPQYSSQGAQDQPNLQQRLQSIGSAQVSKVQGDGLKVGYEEISQQSSVLRTRNNSNQVDRRNASSLLKHHMSEKEEQEETMKRQLRAFQSQLLARESKRHEKIRVRNLANSRTPNDYRRHQSKLNNQSSQELLKNSSSVHRIIAPPAALFAELQSSGQAYGVVGQVNQLSNEMEVAGPQISIEPQSPGASHGLNSKLDIALDLKKLGSRNEIDKISKTDEQKILLRKQVESHMYLAQEPSGAELSSLFRKKNVAQNGRNEAQTAAQSLTIDQTLERDASRQYLDVNFSIGEQSNQPPYMASVIRDQSQILPHNLSLSQVTQSAAHYSDAGQVMGSGPDSLYGSKPKGGRLNKASSKLSLSASSRKPQANWRAPRRQSEMSRLNSETGEIEQVDLLEVKKNQYLALKQKYTGKDSGMALLAKREAENIQRQRARINELKDFKTMMRALKQSTTSSNMNDTHSTHHMV